MMQNLKEVQLAKAAALQVLRHNSKGPFHGLPRTAGWGYPEPYTRDLMLSVIGIAVSGDAELMASVRKTLLALASNQSEHGHIPSMVHDADNKGASDTTPLFLLALAVFRKASGEPLFLEHSLQKSLTWMVYQCPSDDGLIAQQPTSDWRDEQWVLGHGLYVNMVMYGALRLLGYHDQAESMKRAMQHFTITAPSNPHHLREGLVIKQKPYYALWSYKIYSNERFDLLGNALAILSGFATPGRAIEIISWVGTKCAEMQADGILGDHLVPNFFPFIVPGDEDWLPRYERYNLPGNYHNGGVWPFISGLYIAALVAAKKYQLAEEQLVQLTLLVKKAHNPDLKYGFNEWYCAGSGQPMGQDWQSWSASLYLYAAKCVEIRSAPYFIRD